MPQVLFYVLQSSEPEARYAFAARLCEKALESGLNPIIHTDSPQSSQQVSAALWGARPESFIPHATRPDGQSPVVIMDALPTDLPFAPEHCFLINLSHSTVSGLERFTRISEIVIQAPETLATTRRNYAYYKNQGFTPETHKIG